MLQLLEVDTENSPFNLKLKHVTTTRGLYLLLLKIWNDLNIYFKNLHNLFGASLLF